MLEEALGKKQGTQTLEKLHRNFSNLVLHGKLLKAVRFICDQEAGEVFLPNEWTTDRTGPTDKPVAEVLAGKHPPDKRNHSYTLEAY